MQHGSGQPLGRTLGGRSGLPVKISCHRRPLSQSVHLWSFCISHALPGSRVGDNHIYIYIYDDDDASYIISRHTHTELSSSADPHHLSRTAAA